MMNHRRPPITAGIIVALIALILSGCSRGNSKMQIPPVPVVVAEAVVKTVPFEIASIGTGEAFRTVSVRSQVGGVLKRIYFEDGQHIKLGEPLFLIDPAPFKAALAAAEAKLARDRATAGNLQESVERYNELAKKDYITPQEYSDMRSNLEAMRATVLADSADVESANLNLDYCSIRAPIAGRMGTRLIDEGNVVKANSDDAMVLIHQIRPMYVRFSVPEKYLTEILKYSASESLEVRANVPGDTLGVHDGRLTFVDNAVDAATGTILLKALFPNDDMLLWPGEFVNVVLVLKQLDNAVTVPSQAVGTGQNGDYLFVVKPDATAELRPVTVAYRLGNDAVIERGVAAGEKVVVDGQMRLRPGAKVAEKPPLAGGKPSSS